MKMEGKRKKETLCAQIGKSLIIASLCVRNCGCFSVYCLVVNKMEMANSVSGRISLHGTRMLTEADGCYSLTSVSSAKMSCWQIFFYVRSTYFFFLLSIHSVPWSVHCCDFHYVGIVIYEKRSPTINCYCRERSL